MWWIRFNGRKTEIRQVVWKGKYNENNNDCLLQDDPAGFGQCRATKPAFHAQTISTSLDDLILGFYATGAPGQTLNLEVDLGKYEQLL